MKRMLLGPVLFGVAVLISACGDSGTSGTTSSVLNLESTNYHTLAPTQSTLPPTTVTTVPGGTSPGAGSVTTEVTQYTIQQGDVPFSVANRFAISLDALNLANADTAGYSAFYVGLVIKIPVGATIPDTTVPTETSAPADTATTLDAKCVQGTYTIQQGDLPSTVAKKFDVTVDQLDAANVNTKGYDNFVVGVKIIIPATDTTGC